MLMASVVKMSEQKVCMLGVRILDVQDISARQDLGILIVTTP